MKTSCNIGELLVKGMSAHSSGDLTLAFSFYLNILCEDPANYTVLRLLGILWAQQGNLTRGIYYLKSSQRLNVLELDTYINLANAYRESGSLEDSVECYKRSLVLDPRFAPVYYDISDILFDDRCESASVSLLFYGLYLDRVYPGSLDRFFRALNLLDITQDVLNKKWIFNGLENEAAKFFLGRGAALFQEGEYQEAIARALKAIELDRTLAEAYWLKGVILHALGKTREAMFSYDHSLSLKPNSPEAYCDKGLTLYAEFDYEEAVFNFKKALALNPNLSEAHLNIGNALHALSQYERAFKSHLCALSLNPGMAAGYLNLGHAVKELGRWRESLFYYDRALTLQNDLAAARFGRASILLLLGNYAEGWAEYEVRFSEVLGNKNRYCSPDFRKINWNELRGKKILVYPEQGLGDLIQFCRYCILLADLGLHVWLEAPFELRELLGTLDDRVSIVSRSESDQLCFDTHISIMSLPLLFKTTLESIPRKNPYLYADPVKQASWVMLLADLKRQKVGLVWSGGLIEAQPELWAINQRRNIKLALLEGLNTINVDFISLQKGAEGVNQLHSLKTDGWNGPEIIDVSGQLETFADTAAVIDSLDLVLSVDTSTAHLAAAMGKEVWLLIRFDTCWRWLLDREDSPWYTSVRLYRQDHTRSWGPVVQRVIADLSDRFGTAEPSGP